MSKPRSEVEARIPKLALIRKSSPGVLYCNPVVSSSQTIQQNKASAMPMRNAVANSHFGSDYVTLLKVMIFQAAITLLSHAVISAMINKIGAVAISPPDVINVVCTRMHDVIAKIKPTLLYRLLLCKSNTAKTAE